MTVAAVTIIIGITVAKNISVRTRSHCEKKTLPAAVKMTNSASVAKFSAPTGKRTPQNPAEFQSLAAGLRIAQRETKYFSRKTFLFAKITTFTNTAFAKKMVL